MSYIVNGARPLTQFAAVLAAHMVLFALLLSIKPVREVVVQVIPVVASIFPPTRVETPAPPTPSPKTPSQKTETPLEERKPLPSVVTPIIAAEMSVAATQTLTSPAPTQPAVQAALKAAQSTPSAPATEASAKPAASAVYAPPRFGVAYLNNPKPEYPPASRRLGETGRVVLLVQVSATGNVEQVSVESSSGYARLDQAALRAVRQWKFIPARRGDEAVPGRATVPINFTHDDD